MRLYRSLELRGYGDCRSKIVARGVSHGLMECGSEAIACVERDSIFLLFGLLDFPEVFTFSNTIAIRKHTAQYSIRLALCSMAREHVSCG